MCCRSGQISILDYAKMPLYRCYLCTKYYQEENQGLFESQISVEYAEILIDSDNKCAEELQLETDNQQNAEIEVEKAKRLKQKRIALSEKLKLRRLEY